MLDTSTSLPGPKALRDLGPDLALDVGVGFFHHEFAYVVPLRCSFFLRFRAGTSVRLLLLFSSCRWTSAASSSVEVELTPGATSSSSGCYSSSS
jgi:hypothetical protein